jgi:hypothetical protein
MKKLLTVLLATVLVGTVYAGGEMKEVCKDKTDKAGKVINDKSGKPLQVCKTIKVHKKLEGDNQVPSKK